MVDRPVTIESWLDALNMVEYAHLFAKYGGVEDLIFATEAEIKDIGINNITHRAKITSSLRILKDAMENGHANNTVLFSPHQRISNPGSFVPHQRISNPGFFSPHQRISSASHSAPTSPTTSYTDFRQIVSPEKLQADLQRELSGDPVELRSRSWYHGSISRVTAESLIADNGDFLIRDCISKPGDFVLTCKWNDAPLNFIINSIIGYCNPGILPLISYQFEDEQFPTIQQLIKHYQDQGKPVTVASEAILKTPVARSVPLCYYDTKYRGSSSNATPNHSPQTSPFVTPSTSPGSSPNMNRRLVPLLDNQSSQSKRACEDANNNNNSTNNNNNGEIQKNVRPPSLDNLPVINVTPPGENVSHLQSLLVKHKSSRPAAACVRVSSAPELSRGYEGSALPPLEHQHLAGDISENGLTNSPPPKPSRIPSARYKLTSTIVIEGDISESPCTAGTRWTPASPESTQTFQHDFHQRVSLALTLDQSENGQCADCAKTNKTFTRQEGCVQNGLLTSPSSSPNLQKTYRENQSSRVSPTHLFCSDLDQSPRLRTYQCVARSRSFQLPGREQAECTRTGNKTLPNKFSESKAGKLRLTCTGEQENHEGQNSKNIGDKEFFEIHETEQNNFRCMTKPPVSQSYIVPETFKSGLLPKGHKVLDQLVLLNVKTILVNKSPEQTALHLTRYDLALTSAATVKDLGLGVTSGLELLTLPQGALLRQDVIDRWESLRLFTQATLLTSQTVDDRAKLLSFWILTCQELKKTTGNLFSFAAIMAALNSPQISRLTDTWTTLRQVHTASAVVFDTKLRPEFVSLNDASCDLPLKNVCVPYITPICYLLERDVESTLQDFYWEDGLDPIASAIDVLLNHLDLARVIASQSTRYRITGKALLATVNFDPELSQILSPEFHVLLLWGEKGRKVHRQAWLDKLGQIFTLLSHKCQMSEDGGTEV